MLTHYRLQILFTLKNSYIKTYIRGGIKKATAKIAYGRFNLCKDVVYLRLMEISY